MGGELKFPLGEVKQVVHKWLYLEDDRIIDVMIATHLANRFTTDPTWTLIIGPPSSTKTELLRSFDGHPEAYFLSNLTPSTLVSGKSVKRNGKLVNMSLLPSLNDKTLVLKDFTTVLSMRSENQQEILSQFREIYDGSYSKGFGNETGLFEWKGRVGLLGACTPVYDKHYGVIGVLGDRFLLYRTNNETNQEMGLRAQKMVGQEEQMRQEIKEVVHTFIDQFTNLDHSHFQEDPTTNNMIVTLACFCAFGRCPVDRNPYDKTIEYTPQPEGTPRLVKQFMQVGMSLALIYGKDRIDGEVYEVLKKIGRDLIPEQRLKIIKYLWESQAFEHLMGWEGTTDISQALKTPKTTMVRKCEDLMLVGLLERQLSGETENQGYKWQFNQRAYDMMKGAQMFEVTTNAPF